MMHLVCQSWGEYVKPSMSLAIPGRVKDLVHLPGFKHRRNTQFTCQSPVYLFHTYFILKYGWQVVLAPLKAVTPPPPP
ncbi:hypothetical protein SERLA73DRAFT_187243, partial [Serpula lacrymans var. lacrymans S7.3]